MSTWRVVERAGRDQLGEGPLWSARDGALYWVDILARKLHRLRLEAGTVDTWPVPEMIGWVIERAEGTGFIAGLQSGFAQLDLEPFDVRTLGAPESHPAHHRFNDAKADATGRIYAGTMSIDANEPAGALFRLDDDGSITRVDGGYIVPNGPAFSCDGRTLYHTDSVRGRIYRFPVRADGSLGTRALFLEFAPDWGRPDGMTVDAEDHLWVAHWGGSRVSRFTPEGVLANAIPLPASQITSCAFAGANLDRLFVTSAAVGCEHEPLAGALFEITPDVRGMPPNLFGQSSNASTSTRRPQRNASATS